MDEETKKALKERMAQLPQVVRDAITTSSVQKKLRELTPTKKLHIDQWQVLEDQVMLTLMAFQEPDEFEKNIETEVGVSKADAAELATAINNAIFEPIRQELERKLEHPEAQAAKVSDVEAARTSILNEQKSAPQLPAQPAVVAATPPPQPPTARAARAPISSSYAAQQPSHERKAIEGDPYREPTT